MLLAAYQTTVGRASQQWRQREARLCRRVVEERREINPDTAERQSRSGRIAHVFAVQAEVAPGIGRRIANQNEMSEALRSSAKPLQIEIAQDVAVEHHEGRGRQQRERLPQSAPGFERTGGFPRDDDFDAAARASAQMGFDLVTEMRHIDHAARDACSSQRREVMIEQRLAADFDHGLRDMVCERAQALPASGGKNDGLAGYGGGHWRVPKQQAEGAR